MPPTTTTEPVRTSRGGRPRDPSRDGVIREAILHLLGTVGYGALTMDAVAAQAGVGKATIYRRWRTKEDLVVDTISEMSRALADPVDTGTVEGDVRAMAHQLVRMINGPVGTAMRALLPAMHHQPALNEAYDQGPRTLWRDAFREMWARAEARGEVGPGLAGSIPSEAIGALMVQRWLLTGAPVDDAYADEVLDVLVLPLIRQQRP